MCENITGFSLLCCWTFNVSYTCIFFMAIQHFALGIILKRNNKLRYFILLSDDIAMHGINDISYSSTAHNLCYLLPKYPLLLRGS